MPLVSIIIPVYNTEKYLKRCLNSAIHQTYKNIEIIAIDDASTDNSLSILKDYQMLYKNKNFLLISSSDNVGVAESRNIGLKQANGDYIFFLDSDDAIKENAIEELIKLALTYNTSLVEAEYQTVFNQKKQKTNEIDKKIKEIDIEKNKEYLYSERGAVWNKLFSHSLIEEEKFPNGLIFEDAAFLYPVLTKAKKTVHTSEKLYYYYRHRESITLTNKFKPNENLFDIYTICNLIKKRCKELNTYTLYQKVLEEIIKSKYVYALLEIDTWLSLGFKKQMILLNTLQNYEDLSLNDLFSTNMVKKRMQEDFIFHTRINILKMHLKMAEMFYPTLSYNPLEEAKEIITRYRKK